MPFGTTDLVGLMEYSSLKIFNTGILMSVRVESGRGRLAIGGKEKDVMETVQWKKLLGRFASL